MARTKQARAPLKILIAHNLYQNRGGEDTVVDAEVALLRSRGHEVIEYRCTNADIDAQPRVRLLADTLWCRSAHAQVRALIRRHRPDLMHVHNSFPRLSPSIYWAAQSEGLPVVQSLHNFRLVCAQAMFLRDGQICEDCLHTLPWRGALRACYRQSRAQSTALVGMLALHRAIGSFRHKVTRYIALSEFSKQKFVAAGIRANQLSVKPNFVEAPSLPATERKGALFVGRLSQEKGLGVLLDALSLAPFGACKVIGSGPLEALVAKHPQVQWLGWQSQESVREHMRRAEYLLLPSVGYEQFPVVIAEAFASGLPVIASRLGALCELVEPGRTGLLFTPGNAADLADCLKFAANRPEAMRAMSANARAQYELKYTPERNYEQLLGIYSLALNEHPRE